jgi:di/tricarboxylate transporter
MTVTFILLGVTIALFVWGKLPAEIVALLAALSLFLFGVLDARQAVAGFGAPAVVMIAALFVVGEGLANSGLTAWAASKVIKVAQGSPVRLLVLVMLGTAALSAFVSNTGTVATLVPAVVAAAWTLKTTPSRFLIPLAFAANMGGLLTLTGTPPNIVVSQALEDGGMTPLGFFELAWIGLPLLVVGVVYMATVGHRLLPARERDGGGGEDTASVEELAEAYGLESELVRLRVRPESPLVGKTLEEIMPGRNHGLPVMRLERPGIDASSPLTKTSQTPLEAGDALIARATPGKSEELGDLLGLDVVPVPEDAPLEPSRELLSHNMGVAEILVAPRSEHVGRDVSVGAYSDRYKVQVLKVRRRGQVITEDRIRLEEGDALLVRGPWAAVEALSGNPRELVVVGNPEAIRRARLSARAGTALAVLVAMVALMVFGVVPGAIAALLAALAMVLLRCSTRQGAYRSVSWSSVVLIGAMIPMSTALESTGGAAAVAEGLVGTLGEIHPLVLLAGIFLLTTGLSQVINNTATAVLMAPIVIQAAAGMDLSARPFIIVVTVAASTAFLTPVGTSTNLLVYAPGSYRFGDYARVGVPLSILFMIMSLLLVPLVWPLR